MTDAKAKQLRFEKLNAAGISLFCIGSTDNLGFYLIEADMDENACRSHNDVRYTKIPYKGVYLKVSIPLCTECRAKRGWPLRDYTR